MDSENKDCDVDLTNLTILKEFRNIADLVREEEFLDIVPKAKLKRVKWTQIFNCLKQGIFNDMVQELNTMWAEENMQNKLEVLEKQKAKFADNTSTWRPELGDVKAQLKAQDAVHLLKQKKFLETLATDYESRVSRLKKSITAKRGYIKAMRLDIQNYQKKNETILQRIKEKIENHDNYVNDMLPPMDFDTIKWTETGLEGIENNRDST